MLEELLEAARPQRGQADRDELVGIDVGPASLDARPRAARGSRLARRTRSRRSARGRSRGRLRRPPLRSTTPARRASPGSTKLGEPAVAEPADPPQLARGPAAEPHVGRLLHRLRQHPEPLVVEAGAVVVDGVLASRSGGSSGSASSNHGARSLARDAERLLLGAGLATPSPNAGSSRPPESTSRLASSLASSAGLRPGSTCTLVPSLSLRRAPGRDREADDRVGRVAAHPLREPERVEAAAPRARRPARRTASASPRPCDAPSPYPIRTFMPFAPSR